MLNRNIIPAVKAAGVGPLEDLQADVHLLKNKLAEIHHTEDLKTKAKMSRDLRLETMLNIRTHTDTAEEVVPEELWTLPTYKELLFLDQHTTSY